MVLFGRRQDPRQVHVERIAGGIGDPVSRLRFLQMATAQVPASARVRYHWLIWSAVLLTIVIPFWVRRAAGFPEPPKARLLRPEPSLTPKAKVTPVWQVEKTGDSEVYSNGLRIDTRFTVLNHPRTYLVFRRDGAHAGRPDVRSQPVGIVYHTTESRQAPFEAQDNRVLMRLGESLLEYVRRERALPLFDRPLRALRVPCGGRNRNCQPCGLLRLGG